MHGEYLCVMFMLLVRTQSIIYISLVANKTFHVIIAITLFTVNQRSKFFADKLCTLQAI